MNLNDWKITLNGQPVSRSDSIVDLFPDTRSKNQKKKDRKEFFKNKRKQSGSLMFEIPLEKPWHERIIIREDGNEIITR